MHMMDFVSWACVIRKCCATQPLFSGPPAHPAWEHFLEYDQLVYLHFLSYGWRLRRLGDYRWALCYLMGASLVGYCDFCGYCYGLLLGSYYLEGSVVAPGVMAPAGAPDNRRYSSGSTFAATWRPLRLVGAPVRMGAGAPGSCVLVGLVADEKTIL